MTPTTPEIHDMKRLYVLSTLLIFALGSCKIRVPQGGCPYDEVELSPEFVTPWGTVLGQDLEALAGPFLGIFTWYDGDDVITVPRAGEVTEVEALVEFDLSTARYHKYIKTPEHKGGCEPDRILVDARVSFVRVDDDEVELSVPFTAYRYDSSHPYSGEAEIMPVGDFTPDLDPRYDHELEAVFANLGWHYQTGQLNARFTYTGQTITSPTTGVGNFKLIAEFVVPE